MPSETSEGREVWVYSFIYLLMIYLGDGFCQESILSLHHQYEILETRSSRSSRIVRAPFSGGQLQRPSLYVIRSATLRTCTVVEAERDKREVANVLYNGGELSRLSFIVSKYLSAELT